MWYNENNLIFCLYFIEKLKAIIRQKPYKGVIFAPCQD